MDEKKVFINYEGIAVVVCPKCNASKSIDARKYRKINKAIRVKCRCRCGSIFSVLLERREYFRKSTNLPGSYKTKTGKESGNMRVEDISRTGLSFKAYMKPHLQLGETVIVEFRLDDKDNTFICKEAVIKSISDMKIRGEFCRVSSSDIIYDKAIGFYMMNRK